MASLPSFVRLLLLAVFVLGAGSAVAQDELRKTFFKDVDAARAAADAVNAYLLAPRSYSAAVKDYDAADVGLNRGRNIEYVRTKVGRAEKNFKTATTAAQLAKTVLSQVMKSRQDAANAKSPQLSPEIWDKAQREFGSAIRYLERGDLKNAKRKDIEATSLYRDAEADRDQGTIPDRNTATPRRCGSRTCGPLCTNDARQGKTVCWPKRRKS